MSFSVFQNPPIGPPGGDFPPQNSKFSKFCPIVFKFGMYILWHITRGRVLSVFRNSPTFPPLGGEIPPPPKSPHLELSSDYLEIQFGMYALYPITLRMFFFSVFRIPPPPSPPRGGLPPKIPKSWNLVRLSWNLVCMYSGTLLEDEFCPFSQTPPQFPPSPTPKFIIFKYCWIVLVFGMCVLYHNIKRLLNFYNCFYIFQNCIIYNFGRILNRPAILLIKISRNKYEKEVRSQ